MAYTSLNNDGKGKALLLLASYVNRLYPDLKLLDDKKYLAETAVRRNGSSDTPLADRLVDCGAISRRTIRILEDVLADSSFEAPDLFVQAGKGYFAKNKNYSPEEKQRMCTAMEQALKEQAELRKSGKYVPRIGELLKQKGFSELDIEIISTLQLADFLKKNSAAAAKVRLKLGGSMNYIRSKMVSDNPVKNMVLAGVLGAAVALGGAVYWASRPKGPELSYEHLPKYYQGVLSSIQFKEIDDPALTGIRAQIRLTSDCLNALDYENLEQEQREEAEEIQRKLELIEANLDRVKGMPAKDLLRMNLTEIERLLMQNDRR